MKIQYWDPTTKTKNASVAYVYKDCWRKSWRCNTKDPERWEHASSIVWSWTPKKRNGTSIEAEKSKLKKTIKIPKSVVEKAKVSLSLGGSANDDSASNFADNTNED